MRDIVTTAFEVLGLLLLSAAICLLLWTIHPAAGLAGAGLSLLVQSALVLRFSGEAR